MSHIFYFCYALRGTESHSPEIYITAGTARRNHLGLLGGEFGGRSRAASRRGALPPRWDPCAEFVEGSPPGQFLPEKLHPYPRGPPSRQDLQAHGGTLALGVENPPNPWSPPPRLASCRCTARCPRARACRRRASRASRASPCRSARSRRCFTAMRSRCSTTVCSCAPVNRANFRESSPSSAAATPRGSRSLPVREGALCARSRTTEQGSGVSPLKLPPHARLHVYTIGAAQRRASAGKVPHSGVSSPCAIDAAHQAAKSPPP